MSSQGSKSHPLISQSDLQKQLREVDPGAVLVSARILERVIQDAYDLPNLHWNTPHNQSFVCDRQLLFRHAEQVDLEVEPDQLLPERVLLLVRPDAVEESSLERSRLLTKYWRRLFHARIHFHFLDLKEKGNWDETTFRKRMESVGLTQFEEIRNVLREDNWLHSNAGIAETYIEFVAVYLELQFFTLDFQQNYFPGIRDFSEVNRLIAMDIDGEKLFHQTKLAGALDPKITVDGRTDENQVTYWRYVRSAQKYELKGDVVSAAIFRIRASRVASANETVKARKEANADIARLSKRLATALQMNDDFRDILSDKLVLLLEKADQGNHSMEARVLQDLQKVCQDHEQEIFTLDLVEYLLSGGKRPIKRPLPSQRLVRITQHLSNAVEKMNSVRLAETELRELTTLLQQLQSKATNQLSARFRPVLETAFSDMGLSPQGPLQKASYEKMIMEVLDRINSYGYLTFAELRDTISRNQLKLPDLKDPEDFIQGDPLIRLDRRLTSLLDGVYRSSDFYVRWLERFTSWQFGTLAGRYLTLFFTIPFLLAWLLLFLVGFILEWGNRLFFNVPTLETIALVMMGPAHLPSPEINAEQTGTISHWWHFAVVIPTALFLLGLLQSDSFRTNIFGAFKVLGAWIYKFLWKIPISHIPLHLINQVVNSWPFQVAWSLLIKPLALWLPVYLAFRHQVSLGWAVVLFFIVFIPVINSRTGRAFTESIGDSFLHFGTLIQSGLVPGLIRLIIQVFKQIVEFIEYVLFKVDEWLRFRAEDGQSSLLLRIFIGLFWYPVAFLARFYMVVLIEPGLNPIKFAISSVAAKIVYPLILTMGLSGTLTGYLQPFVGESIAYLLVVPTLWLLPDAFGFLVWEFKENWSLYRANRGKKVKPALVTDHGEGIRGLLQPGFHSGTIPKLYYRIRKAENRANSPRSSVQLNRYKNEMNHYREAVKRYVTREMIFLLNQSQTWVDQVIEAGDIHLSTNRIRIQLLHHSYPKEPLEIEIEHHDGLLLAGFAKTGWAANLEEKIKKVLIACLIYFYKRSDIDVVREQVALGLKMKPLSVQIDNHSIFAWADWNHPPQEIPLVNHPENAAKFLFSRTPLTWTAWDAAWATEENEGAFPFLEPFKDCIFPTNGLSESELTPSVSSEQQIDRNNWADDPKPALSNGK